MDWTQYLAQEGYIVACIDPRGTAARGEEFRKCTYMQLGKIESDDMIAAAKWLAGQSYIDAQKVGIWGWRLWRIHVITLPYERERRVLHGYRRCSRYSLGILRFHLYGTLHETPAG